MTFDVKLPNGQVAKATYRNTYTDAAFVRINGKTVSGLVEYVGFQQPMKFKPSGQNASLVR